jgi:hypothetical protein
MSTILDSLRDRQEESKDEEEADVDIATNWTEIPTCGLYSVSFEKVNFGGMLCLD